MKYWFHSTTWFLSKTLTNCRQDFFSAHVHAISELFRKTSWKPRAKCVAILITEQQTKTRQACHAMLQPASRANWHIELKHARHSSSSSNRWGCRHRKCSRSVSWQSVNRLTRDKHSPQINMAPSTPPTATTAPVSDIPTYVMYDITCTQRSKTPSELTTKCLKARL